MVQVVGVCGACCGIFTSTTMLQLENLYSGEAQHDTREDGDGCLKMPYEHNAKDSL